MPELTVAQAYALDKRFGWIWYLGASRPVRNKLGVRFIGEPWKQRIASNGNTRPSVATDEGSVEVDGLGPARPLDHRVRA